MQTYLEDCLWGRFLLLKGDFISDHMRVHGEWSEAEVALLRLLLTPDSIVIEVGSNIGSHAVPLARACARGRVYCFEPQRPIFTLLCANLALNGIVNAHPLQCAVGAQEGVLHIETSDYSEPFNYGSFSLERGFSTESAYPSRTWREPVRLTTLDTEPILHGLPRLDLLKIDVEGMEEQVLRGGECLIREHQPVLFCEANKAQAFDSLREALHRLGYTPYWFVARRFREGNFKRSTCRVQGVDVNLVAFPPSRPPPGLQWIQATRFEQVTSGEVKAWTL